MTSTFNVLGLKIAWRWNTY